MSVDAFNLVAGVISILAAGFAVWVHQDGKKKAAVEQQKSGEYQQRLADLLSMANAIAQHAMLIASIADREEVTKKELKHLTLGQLMIIQSLQSSLKRTRAVESAWRFGIPTGYTDLKEVDSAHNTTDVNDAPMTEAAI